MQRSHKPLLFPSKMPTSCGQSGKWVEWLESIICNSRPWELLEECKHVARETQKEREIETDRKPEIGKMCLGLGGRK